VNRVARGRGLVGAGVSVAFAEQRRKLRALGYAE
jgi:hypothetical protein